jgi:hypothetical protein
MPRLSVADRGDHFRVVTNDLELIRNDLDAWAGNLSVFLTMNRG